MLRLIKAMALNILAPRTSFMEDNFSVGLGTGDGLGIIQVHCIYCVLYFYYYSISSSSDHQALDLEDQGPNQGLG